MNQFPFPYIPNFGIPPMPPQKIRKIKTRNKYTKKKNIQTRIYNSK